MEIIESVDVADVNMMMLYSMMESIVLETLLAAGNSLVTMLMMIGSLPNINTNVLPKEPVRDERISLVDVPKTKSGPENKDASETEDDDEDDDEEDAGEQDDAGDDEYEGEEDNEEDDEEDPDDPEANGEGGSDDDDDDDDDEDDDEDEEEDDEDDDEDEDTPQPPAKKRK